MTTELVPEILKSQKKKIILWAIILLVVNIILTIIDPYNTSYDLTGKVVSGWEVKRSVFSTLTIGFAIISLILSIFFTFIPFKNIPYGQKYFYFALIIYFALQCIFCLLEAKNLWFSYIHYIH